MPHLLAYGLMIALGFGALLHFGPLIFKAQREPIENHEAYQLARIVKAARLYITQNFDQVEQAVTGGGGLATVTPTHLINTGALEASYQDTAPFFTQRRVIVRRLASGRLAALVVACGGTPPTQDTTIIRLAQLAGPEGGMILAEDATVATRIVGATGGWIEERANFATADCPLTGRRLAAAIYFDQGQVVPPYLHRFAVPGAPEATRMGTTIDMDGHRIEAAGDVTLREKGRSLAQAVQDMVSVQPGETVPKPNCVAPQVPEIFVWAGWTDDGGQGRALHGDQAYWEDVGLAWSVHLRVYTQNAAGTALVAIEDPPGTRVIVATKCN